MIKVIRKKTYRDKYYMTMVISTQFPHETCWVEGALTMLNTYLSYCKFHVLTNENGEAIIGLRLFRALENNVNNVVKMLNRKG